MPEVTTLAPLDYYGRVQVVGRGQYTSYERSSLFCTRIFWWLCYTRSKHPSLLFFFSLFFLFFFIFHFLLLFFFFFIRLFLVQSVPVSPPLLPPPRPSLPRIVEFVKIVSVEIRWSFGWDLSVMLECRQRRQERKCTYWLASALSYWSAARCDVEHTSLRVGPRQRLPKMYIFLSLARFILISSILCIGKRWYPMSTFERHSYIFRNFF